MGSTKSERRRKIRFDVVGLQGGVRLPSDARIVDLGYGGLGVETAHWLQVGRGYTIHLSTGGKNLRVAGTVAWCRLARTVKNEAGESVPLYKAGIQFQDPDAATIEAIEGLLSGTAQVGLSDEIRGRFRYRREPAVDVEIAHAFTVRRLSLTGMLVEAGFLPREDEVFRVALAVEEGTLELVTRVAYVEAGAGSEEPTARVGLEFVGLDGPERKAIRAIILSEVASTSAPFVGNPETGIYHRASCHHAPGCTTAFRNPGRAEAAGLRAGSCCAE